MKWKEKAHLNADANVMKPFGELGRRRDVHTRFYRDNITLLQPVPTINRQSAPSTSHKTKRNPLSTPIEIRALMQINTNRVAQIMWVQHPLQVASSGTSNIEVEAYLAEFLPQELHGHAVQVVQTEPVRLGAEGDELFLRGEDGGVEVTLCGGELP